MRHLCLKFQKYEVSNQKGQPHCPEDQCTWHMIAYGAIQEDLITIKTMASSSALLATLS